MATISATITTKPATISFETLVTSFDSLEAMPTGVGEDKISAGLLDETLTMPLAHKGLLMSFMRILLQVSENVGM